ncbi:BhlA/UviB family holin-like peptide [Clostridium sp. C8-1-8]|uniref:BhlA/UviB family holin-like peptide n=1 Tax=Clostridium sp. C8-1-8 TaxID=2698831 RepID=UPI00136E3CE6|nr:BhlA/UviB family holin-like peptide [Clostridium sp. C8-1-8]
MDELMKAAISQGLGYALFVFLLIYVLKTTKDREQKLNETITENQNIIVKLTEKFNIVEDIKEDIKGIKDKIFR